MEAETGLRERHRDEVRRRFEGQSRYWGALTRIAGYPGAYERLFARLSAKDMLPRFAHRALDLGTGTGVLAAAYRRRAVGEHRMFGLDLSLGMLGRARGELDGPRTWFTAGDAVELPFRSAMFHVVMSAHCMEHSGEPAAVVSEMARVLRPRGLLVCVIGRPGLLEEITRSVWRYPAIGARDVMAWMWESDVAPLGSMDCHWLSQAVVGEKAVTA